MHGYAAIVQGPLQLHGLHLEKPHEGHFICEQHDVCILSQAGCQVCIRVTAKDVCKLAASQQCDAVVNTLLEPVPQNAWGSQHPGTGHQTEL